MVVLQSMRFASGPVVRSSSEASSAFASCDSINSEDSDDDCQVLDSRPPIFRAGPSPASRDSSWAFRACNGRTRQPKQEKREEDTPSGDDSSDCLVPDSDLQEDLRKHGRHRG